MALPLHDARTTITLNRRNAARGPLPKERAIRRRELKRLWARLKQLSTMQLTREELLMKLGAARNQSRIAWRLAVIGEAVQA